MVQKGEIDKESPYSGWNMQLHPMTRDPVIGGTVRKFRKAYHENPRREEPFFSDPRYFAEVDTFGMPPLT
jgi:hypothetical protein